MIYRIKAQRQPLPFDSSWAGDETAWHSIFSGLSAIPLITSKTQENNISRDGVFFSPDTKPKNKLATFVKVDDI